VLVVSVVAGTVLLPVLAAMGVPMGRWWLDLLPRLVLVGALGLALVLLRRPTLPRRRVAAGLALLPCLAGAALLATAVLDHADADGALVGYPLAPLQLTLVLGAGIYSVVALAGHAGPAIRLS